MSVDPADAPPPDAEAAPLSAGGDAAPEPSGPAGAAEDGAPASGAAGAGVPASVGDALPEDGVLLIGGLVASGALPLGAGDASCAIAIVPNASAAKIMIGFFTRLSFV